MPRTVTLVRRAPAALLLVAALSGSGPAPLAAADPSAVPAPPGGLEGVDWRLARVAGSGVPFIDVPGEVEATLRVDGDRAGGSGGCNQWSADALVDGPMLAFGEILSTVMACEEPRMGFESAYLGFLDDIRAWGIGSDGRLELADGGGAVLLVFDPPAGTGSSGPVALVGPTWRAIELRAGGTATAVPPGIDITLRIDAQGEVSGVAACNQYGGSATVAGDSLVLGPLAVTEMACPEPRMSLERAWLDVLAATAAWRIDGERLELLDAAGAVLATLGPDPAG